MQPEQMPPESAAQHTDVDYEKTDAQVKPVVVIGISIVLLGLLASGVALWAFDAFKTLAENAEPALPPIAARRPTLPTDYGDPIPIPQPRLQVDEHADLKDWRKEDEARLNSYGWIDQKDGKIHIPIAKAMQLFADREAAKAKAEPMPKGGKQ